MKEQFYFKIRKLDEAIGQQVITEKIVEDTIVLLKADDQLANYFFNNVRDLQWFKYLSKEGYFQPGKIPEGRSAFWNVLEYLKRASEKTTENPQLSRELLAIIDNILEFSLNEKRIYSYQIWWDCLAIVCNIPVDLLIENVSSHKLRSWLSVWTDRSISMDLTISDIGEKLLPKFLSDEPALGKKYEYAEAIIDALTETQIDKKSSAITRRKDISLALDPYWIRQVFRTNAQSIGQRCSTEVIHNIADKLKKVLEYKRESSRVNLNIDNEEYQIEVKRIPAEGVGVNKIEFVDRKYRCIVKRVAADQIEKVDEDTRPLALYDIEPENVLKSFIFAAREPDIFFKKIKENLPKDISWSDALNFEDQISHIFDGLYSDNTYVWCKSLIEIPDYHDSADALLMAILRDVLFAKCESEPQEGKGVLNVFLSDRYLFPLFKRFVLVCIDKYWADYKEFLDKFFETFTNPLHEPDFDVELHDIMTHHNSDFSPSFREKLRELIEEVPKYYLEEGEELTACWKYEWLSAVRDNPDFYSSYEEERQKAKMDKPYQPRRSAVEGGVVHHKSPISTEVILQKPIEELVGYLTTFKGADMWGTFAGDPDKQGLAMALQASVKENPGKFTDGLEEFCVVDHFYLQSIFRGFSDVWKANNELDWAKVFGFATKFFERDKTSILEDAFKAEDDDSGKGKYIWVVDEITNLIEEGSKDDLHAFDPLYFDDVEKIFGLILPLLKSAGPPDQRDALTHALNTTLGRTVKAYISFSLRAARRSGTAEAGWGTKRFERFFNAGIEAVIWFGCYLPQMRYLDEQYTIEKIRSFADKSPEDPKWQMFMEGYLEGSQVYHDVYGLMRQNYQKTLDRSDNVKREDERLVQHICIGYLYFDELLAEKNNDGQVSLFWKMLVEAGRRGKRSRWPEVINHFRSVTRRVVEKPDGEEISKDIKSKILEFWSWSYERQDFVQSVLVEDYHSFLGHLAELTNLLEKIDETKGKWLLLSAPHAERDSAVFIESLSKFDDDESVKRIGKIFLKVLEKSTPRFRQEHIEQIVRRIYEKGSLNDADTICNTYGRRGVHFLRPLWEEYHRKHS